MNIEPKALIITVNFQNAECTLEFLTSVFRLDGFSSCRLVIVDNDSGDGSDARIREAISEFSNVQLLASPLNRGYFGGAKWALDQHLATHNLPEWVIVCNNDIIFDNPAFLSGLLAMDPQSEGVVAPAVISSLTGVDANPMIAERPGRIRILRYRLLLSTYYMARLAQRLAPLVRKMRRVCARGSNRGYRRARIYAPHGSFFVFSRRFFEQGGGIDDGSFLYGEEISVAEQCFRLGLPIMHDPELMVRHNDSQTTGRWLTRQGYLQQKAGFRYALGKYLQPGSVQRHDAGSFVPRDSVPAPRVDGSLME